MEKGFVQRVNEGVEGRLAGDAIRRETGTQDEQGYVDRVKRAAQEYADKGNYWLAVNVCKMALRKTSDKVANDSGLYEMIKDFEANVPRGERF